MSHFQTVNMLSYTCWVCGTPFAVAAKLIEAKKRDNKTLFCPSGCRLGLGESEADKLRRKLEQQEAATQRANQRLQRERKSHAATKGKLTKTKKRVANGVCPCCKRTFKQLAAHMKRKHPEYVAGA